MLIARAKRCMLHFASAARLRGAVCASGPGCLARGRVCKAQKTEDEVARHGKAERVDRPKKGEAPLDNMPGSLEAPPDPMRQAGRL